MASAERSGSAKLKIASPKSFFADRFSPVVQYILDGFLALTALGAVALSPFPGTVIFRENFNYPNGLITNEYAFRHEHDPSAVISPHWVVTSGSLFAFEGTGWTGVPDAAGSPADGLSGTNSAVFRLVTKREDFGDVAVRFDLLNRGLTSTRRTPAVDWDGAHVFIRYQSPTWLYSASINRRDNTIVIKKKVPGGPTYGGTYYELTPHVSYRVPYDSWQKVGVTVRNNVDGSVSIQVSLNGLLVLAATDTGAGGPPITQPGRVGIRGDNADLRFTNFAVSSLTGKITSGNESPLPRTAAENRDENHDR